MGVSLEAACLCNTGRVRRNNEDNFCFNGSCLPVENGGLDRPALMMQSLRKDCCLAVFDGMGGENFGEEASYAAAACMLQTRRSLWESFRPPEEYLRRLCGRLNEAVLARADQLRTQYMGTTMVALYFTGGSVCVCNLGDSRAYRLREGQLRQLSIDHAEKRAGKKKAPLTQHLGISPEDFLIEPALSAGKLRAGDRFLLCSDGLTDMLSDAEIVEVMEAAQASGECAERLVRAALEKGGRDNVTVIVCRILD